MPPPAVHWFLHMLLAAASVCCAAGCCLCAPCHGCVLWPRLALTIYPCKLPSSFRLVPVCSHHIMHASHLGRLSHRETCPCCKHPSRGAMTPTHRHQSHRRCSSSLPTTWPAPRRAWAMPRRRASRSSKTGMSACLRPRAWPWLLCWTWLKAATAAAATVGPAAAPPRARLCHGRQPSRSSWTASERSCSSRLYARPCCKAKRRWCGGRRTC